MSQLATHSNGSQYTDNDRREVMAHYVLLGNAQKVADLTNIPRRTINDWTKSEWGQELLASIRLDKSDEIDASITNMMDKATVAITDRIENGDPTVIKYADTYEVVNVGMKGRDLATVFGITFDKRQIIRNLPTSIKAESTDARLTQLADKVRELQAGSPKIIEHDSE